MNNKIIMSEWMRKKLQQLQKEKEEMIRRYREELKFDRYLLPNGKTLKIYIKKNGSRIKFKVNGRYIEYPVSQGLVDLARLRRMLAKQLGVPVSTIIAVEVLVPK